MELNSKESIKVVLMELLEKYLGMEYVSNYNALDADTWTFGLIQSKKNMNYEDMIIPIVGKLADVETYVDRVTSAFYDDIDSIFTARRDSFDNQTLVFNMILEAKIRLTK